MKDREPPNRTKAMIALGLLATMFYLEIYFLIRELFKAMKW